VNDAVEYDIRSQQHRPTDPKRIAAEIMRLRREGLRPRDIAQCMRMNDHDVIQIIAGEIRG
jgi:hypothetical protein